MNLCHHAILLVLLGSLSACKPKPPITKVEALAVARDYIIKEHLEINPYSKPPQIEFFKHCPGHFGPIWKLDFTHPIKNAPRTPDGEIPRFGPIIWVRANGTIETNEWHSL